MSLPTRSCIACRGRGNRQADRHDGQGDLLRIVKSGDEVLPDPNAIAPGRGAWLHLGCFERARMQGSFTRAFKSEERLSCLTLEKYLQSLMKH